ncbi:competence protein ComGA [Carnobacterium iners]|uniref:Competence protein ComGA n=1 Tax=Carnobacterium iners TaxID=1073423 RepID=A0A1X7NRD6_9LACT|nr:competence type IV pilus ATPase ComGA [Carnobacterium iners]SEL15908.1 competence protein ComGA [Carnobacterium iners]SMH40632.1 competence protein ComGA [Carnobacterium iners]
MEIEKFAENLILEARNKGASDVHLLPELTHYFLFFRISGEMQKHSLVESKEANRLISYFKYLSGMDVGERRKPQSGSVQLALKESKQALRFSTISNFRSQESLVIRLLNKMHTGSLKYTTFFQNEVIKMNELVRFKSGLILFSGPVGSGKTTTMYQLIKDYHSERSQQVITVEDPVEIEETSFLQTEVNEKAGIYYETLLKSSLRHHPDTMIIGEIRDEETAKMVIRGALTGHLIIATIHAKNAVGVLSRLLELGVTIDQLRQTLLGIIFQKLVPKRCFFCEEETLAVCSHFKGYGKRAVIYEVLTKNELQSCLSTESILNNQQTDTPRSFNRLLRKAYAYGYITTTTFQKYQIP